MTEYATTPSAVEEWKSQRNRTADWVHSSIAGLPPSADEDSDFEKRSLWDGAGWEVPSDCESATSVPPTMMLQYPDARQVLVTPTTSHVSASNAWSQNESRNGTRRSRAHTHSGRTERARSARPPTESARASVPKSTHETGMVPSQTSSARLARAAAAPLPESRSSSSASGSGGAHSASVAPPVPAPIVRPTQSHAPSHHSHVPSHHPSHAPSHQLPHVPSHHPSHAPSYHSQPQHPPSAFSNHTAVALPPPPAGAGGSPPSINSINSRAISLADSRSSGPPEPIVIHPPTASSSRSTAGPSPSHTHPPGPGNGGAYPQAYLPSTSLTTQTVPPTAHVPLPPPSTVSASLSYYSVPRQSRVYEQHQQQQLQLQLQQRQSITPSHHTAHAQQNAQLPTPVSPTPHAPSIYASQPMRAASSASATGLGGGFVLIEAPSPGYEHELEQELAAKKNSLGNKSTASQRRERGSLFNVFSVGRQGGHNRSRSLPMAGMDDVGARVEESQQAPGSPASHHTHRSHQSQQNPYLTPISPTSPMYPSPVDPARGPHPPSIVYAPARHHRATHYAPPRIMYMPASPRGQRHAPYDTHQLLQAQAYPQYGVASATGYVPAPAPGTGLGVEYGVGNVGSGSVRRSKTAEDGVRDSGWGEGKRENSMVRVESGANADDFVARDYGNDHAHVHSPTSPRADPAPAASSPSASHAVIPPDPVRITSTQSDATSARTNMAGVGTVSARSRSRGAARAHSPDRNAGREGEREGERSRSRARGMVYSASAPQPHGSAPPHAAMMIPPSTARDRGVRDTPYPTPPGSTSEHQYQLQQQQQQQQQHSPVSGGAVNGHPHGSNHRSSLAPVFATAGDASPGPGGLISRFRDIYHPSHGAVAPAADRDAASTSQSRGRARERRKKEPQSKMLAAHGHVRSRSVDSEMSHSSASTYYVIPTPGQKVRIIRTDGQAVTATTSVSRNPSGGGWLKKAAALRPRFLHRDTTTVHPPAPDSSEKHSGAPALAATRTPSGESAKSGAKKGGRKLVRRNSTGSAALLAISRQASTGTAATRDVDIVIPGR